MFVLKPLYTNYLSKKTALAIVEKSETEKQASLDKLVALQKAFATGSGSTEIVEKVKKIDQKFDTSNIMSTVMLNDYTRAWEWGRPRVAISSVSVDKWAKLPNGLSLGTVSVSLSTSSVEEMIDFITYLTQLSNFVFTINSITLPIDTTNTTGNATWVSLNLALGVYYYE